MNSPKGTKNQQDHEKLEQKGNQRSGTGMSPSNTGFSFLIVVVQDTFYTTKVVFMINHLAHTLKYSNMDLGKKLNRLKDLLT